MNHPFYIGKDVYESYSCNSLIIDLDQIRFISSVNNRDDEDEWCINVSWSGTATTVEGDTETSHHMELAFTEQSDMDTCFADIRKAIFTARKIDEELGRD